MKKFIAAILFAAPLWAATPNNFRYQASVQGDFIGGKPARIPLSPEIIQNTEHGLSDLRIFNSSQTEVPYVLFNEISSAVPERSYSMKNVNYQESKNEAILTVAWPEKQPQPIHQINISTGNVDFYRKVDVYVSENQKAWKKIKEDVIFDFSSKVNLRKTSILFPSTQGSFLQLRFYSNGNDSQWMQNQLELKYQGLELKLKDAENAPLHIQEVASISDAGPSLKETMDHYSMNQFRIETDPQKNTILELGRVNLPVQEIFLQVENPYFYRNVVLLGSDVEEKGPETILASGIIYRLPAMPSAEAKLKLYESRKKYYKLKISNGDNPPLKITGVTLSWIKKSIVFIPEEGAKYVLSIQGPNLPSPNYELANLISLNPLERLQDPILTLSDIKENSQFSPEPTLGKKEKDEQLVLKIIVMLAVGAMVFWVFRLIKNMPSAKT